MLSHGALYDVAITDTALEDLRFIEGAGDLYVLLLWVFAHNVLITVFP